MKISQHDDSISRAGYTPVPGGDDSLHFCHVSKTPPLKIERIQDASPSSALRLVSSFVSGHKTRRHSSPCSSNISPARNLWRGLLPALLCLPLLFGLAAPAAAQTTPSISPSTLIEHGVTNGEGTLVTIRNIPSSWVAPVNHSLTTTGTGTGHAILANAGNCGIADAFGNSLDTYDVCDAQASGYDADSNLYQIGLRASLDSHSDSGETFTVTLTDSSTPPNTVSFTMTINDPPPEISASLPDQEGVSRVDGKQPHEESVGSVAFDLSADEPLANDLTVCVRVSESGGNRVASGNEDIQTATLLASGTSNGSGSYTVTWTDTAADDPDSTVIVQVVPPETVGCSATDGSYAVSTDDSSDTVLITDDEDTTVSLTASSDTTMTEGDATDTAVLTISLDRRLYAGETIGVPIALASTTGARLPGSTDGGNVANHDFTVAAAAASMHSGVTLANALTANPRVVFTGHDTNTVQTATVTLTPVANRDDGDAAHETITATLSSLGLLDTTVSGGVTAHASEQRGDPDAGGRRGCPGRHAGHHPVNRRAAAPAGDRQHDLHGGARRSADGGCGGEHRPDRTGGLSNGDNRAVDTDSYQLTFTTSNWSEAQTVRVTGSDEAGTHRNRALWLNHSVSSSDTRYSGLSNINLRVDVDDAPEVEAYWDFKGRLGPHPSTLNLAGEGNPEATQNAAPFTIMSYAVRLSNRPEPGGTVTVTATVPSDKRHLIGLSLNGSYPWRSSVNVEFKDRDAGAGTGCSNWHGLRKNEYFDSSGNKQTVTGGSNSETWDNSADTPWECWRRIHVIRYSASRNIANTCVDITHTATGGGVRRVAIDTVRAHIINSGSGRKCGWLIGNTLSPQGSPAQAASAPTEKISNLQVTAVDAASASVTWDAVEHATSYDVSWSAESSDSLNASAGAESVTGTTATIRHDALVPMTLTVTVTPEYIDENGVTQQLDLLAGTTTLAVGPLGQRLESGGGTNDGNGGSIDSGEGAVDFPVPVSHWRFEYDAVDWVGSSHGTESGGVAFEANEEGEGVDDHALSLDGSDDYVDLSTHVSDFPLGDSTRSVTGWFKADAGNQGQTFFAYGPNVAGKRFSIAADRTQVLVAVSGHAWGVNGLELQEGWHHIAVTYAGGDSDDISIYLDGELQSASTLVGSPKRLNTGTGPAAIGRSVNGKNHYAGLIDDVRLYDVALSAEQVLALFEEHTQTVLVEDNPDDEPSEQSIEADDEEADDGAVDLPDPVSHWSFDNDAVDGAGSSHGTVSGGAVFTANEDGEGVGSHALSLDGSNDHVDLDLHVSNFPLGDTTRSVSGWFRADTGSQGQTFLSYGPNVAGKRFSIAADRTQVLVGVSGHAWGVNGLNLTDGWHHVAVTYAGGKSDAVLIYLDGELQSASTLAGSPQRLNTGTGPAAIGQNVGGTKHYTGSIDDVRLYDVALSAEQVRALFDEHPQL